jgi:1-aminocyclopropane-1-carboxylate synthase
MYRKANAGLFVYADLSPFLPDGSKEESREREFKLAQHFVDNKVFLHPGEEHCQKVGWFRIVYARLSQEILVEGLGRLVIIIFMFHLLVSQSSVM